MEYLIDQFHVQVFGFAFFPENAGSTGKALLRYFDNGLTFFEKQSLQAKVESLVLIMFGIADVVRIIVSACYDGHIFETHHLMKCVHDFKAHGIHRWLQAFEVHPLFLSSPLEQKSMDPSLRKGLMRHFQLP